VAFRLLSVSAKPVVIAAGAFLTSQFRKDWR